jgi:transmembrane sensor
MLSEAAEWYARLRDGSASSHEIARWQAWLHAAEEHQTAWHYVEDISRGMDPLRSTSDPRRTADALSTAHERLHARRRILITLAAIASGGTLAMLGWRETMLSSSLLAWTADHRSPTGEQRAITLADGTHIWLNTASAINLHFNTSERRITLVQGEIFIETAREKARHFLVETSHGRMQALGTRFNVRLNQAQTQLDVYEGAVEIRTASSGISRVVTAGQQSSFDRADIAALITADAAREAWIQGMLLANNIPLRQVAQELRRYRAGHLGVADDVAELKVYGNFPLNDTDRALRMLASALPIRIEQPLPWWTTLEAAR